ncbi:MAG: LysM peptidoglycan-binding domain-containing protein [Christensenellaceae bacterium]|nr:LysM peptidoglycan-binding domain-containing protein [Christensenellaceae bacterium]
MTNAADRCKKGSFYVIKKGETLSGIASRFNMNFAELLSSNPYLDPSYYIPGQTIVIPYGCMVKQYTVSQNDTLADILRRFDTDAKTLRRLNPSDDMLSLMPGKQINVPDKRSGADYIIRDEDTLESIAVRFGTDIVELLRKNPNLRPNEFVAGQGIRVL